MYDMNEGLGAAMAQSHADSRIGVLEQQMAIVLETLGGLADLTAIIAQALDAAGVKGVDESERSG